MGVPNPTTFGTANTAAQPLSAQPGAVRESLFKGVADAAFGYFMSRAQIDRAEENRIQEIQNQTVLEAAQNGYRLAAEDAMRELDTQEFETLEERRTATRSRLSELATPFKNQFASDPRYYSAFENFTSASLLDGERQATATHGARVVQKAAESLETSLQDRESSVFLDSTRYGDILATQEAQIASLAEWGLPLEKLNTLKAQTRERLAKSALTGDSVKARTPEQLRALVDSLFKNDTQTYGYLSDIDGPTKQALGIKLLSKAEKLEAAQRKAQKPIVAREARAAIDMAFETGNVEFLTDDLLQQIVATQESPELAEDLIFAKQNAFIINEVYRDAVGMPAALGRKFIQEQLDPATNPNLQQDPLTFKNQQKLYRTALEMYNKASEFRDAYPLEFFKGDKEKAREYYRLKGIAPSKQIMLGVEERTILAENLMQLGKTADGAPNYAGITKFFQENSTLSHEEKKALLADAGLPAETFDTARFLSAVVTPATGDYVLKAMNFKAGQSLTSTFDETSKLAYKQAMSSQQNRLNQYKQYMAQDLGAEDALGFGTRFLELVDKAVQMEITARGANDSKSIESAVTSAINRLIPPLEKVGASYVPADKQTGILLRNRLDDINNKKEQYQVAIEDYSAPPSAALKKPTTDTMGYAQRVAQVAPLVQYWAGKTGVPADLLMAQLKQESGFVHRRGDKLIGSSAGAQGISQFLPSTAKSLAKTPEAKKLGLSANLDDMFNALGLQAVYMQRNLKTHNGDWKKALAAYNGGPGAVPYLEKTGWKYDPNAPENAWSKQTAKYVMDISASRKAFASQVASGNIVGLNDALKRAGKDFKNSVRLVPGQNGTYEMRLAIPNADGVVGLYPVRHVGGNNVLFSVPRQQ